MSSLSGLDIKLSIKSKTFLFNNMKKTPFCRIPNQKKKSFCLSRLVEILVILILWLRRQVHKQISGPDNPMSDAFKSFSVELLEQSQRRCDNGPGNDRDSKLDYYHFLCSMTTVEMVKKFADCPARKRSFNTLLRAILAHHFKCQIPILTCRNPSTICTNIIFLIQKIQKEF